MTDHLPTRLTDDVVSGLPLSVARQELLEEIMSTPVIDTVDPATRPPRRTRGWAIAVAAAAAVALVVAVPLWASRDDGARTCPSSRSRDRAPRGSARSSLHPAGRSSTSPRSPRRATTHAADGRRLDVHSRPADQYDSYVADREDIGDAVGRGPLRRAFADVGLPRR